MRFAYYFYGVRILKILLFILVAGAIFSPVPASADPSSDLLGTCLTDSTSGKERKDLARWMFVAMAAHPELRGLSTVSGEAKQQADQSMGRLVTKLLTESCARETRTAIEKGGVNSLETAFGTLGKVAMQEIMTNPDVNASITAFEKYVDRKKLAAVMAK